MLIEGVREACRLREPGLGLVLAGALFNSLFYAEAERDLDCQKVLLGEFRGLSRAFPDDAGVQNSLARSLFNSLNYAIAQNHFTRIDDLLAELRSLAVSYPDDPYLREQFAGALYNTLCCAETGIGARFGPWLDELRVLARTHPNDAFVRKLLAQGLNNKLVDALQHTNVTQRDVLLAELRALSTACPRDAVVRQNFAMGLYNTLAALKAEDAAASREDLTELLVAIADDAAYRARLGARAHRSALFTQLQAELQSLARAHPDDAAVRRWLAKAVSTR